MSKTPLSFRLERDVVPVLNRAARAAGMKVSNFVEEAVLEKLSDIEKQRTSQEIENLREETSRLRMELALATEAILVVAGSKQPFQPEAAKAWVETHLKTR